MLKYSTFLLVLLAICLGMALGHEGLELENAPDELTEQTFKVYVEEHKKFSLVVMYAPWCGHCRAMLPKVAKLKQTIEADPELESQFQIGSVDCTKEKSICNRFHVRGYPTVLGFYDGKVVQEYEGQRSQASFLGWMQNLVKQPKNDGKAHPLTKSEFTPVTHRVESKHVVLFHWARDTDEPAIEALNKVAAEFQGQNIHAHTINCVQETVVCEKFNVDKQQQDTAFIISGSKMFRLANNEDANDMISKVKSFDSLSTKLRPGLSEFQPAHDQKLLILAIVCGVLVIFLFCIVMMICLIDDEEAPQIEETETTKDPAQLIEDLEESKKDM